MIGRILIAAALTGTMLASAAPAQRIHPREFASPPAASRPTVTIEEGAGYAAPLDVAARRAIEELDAGAIMISPQGDPARALQLDVAALTRQPIGLLERNPPNATPWLPVALPGEARFGSYLADGRGGPGAAPSLGYFTPEWFAMMRTVLDLARRNGRSATYYDEAGFPSGSADHTIPSRYHRQLLRREELTLSGGEPYRLDISPEGAPLALVAVNPGTGERVDLLALAANGRVDWTAPRGRWLVQRFFVTRGTARRASPDYYGAADYLDPDATRWFIENSYERAYQGLREHFGSTIRFTFFDDVGILPDEATWHPSIAERFERITGRPASLYYPALWDDIGPETAAARVAFFRARSEILGETFPRLITEWANAHGLRSTGHAPGNYDLQPTDTIGDPFKFYAHTDVPLADALWGLGFARGGFKLISSVSAQRDLPLTATEAFSLDNDANGYRRAMELLVRGFNHFIIGARVPSHPRGTPAEFSRWLGRSAYLLEGGRHVADIALLFPIESLQAFYSLNAPGNTPDLPWGTYAYRDADYQAVGEMLVSELHRDFTFVHPEALGDDRLRVRGRVLEMPNRVNREQFRALIIPGGEVISVAALRKAKAFWEAGGVVIATSLLPSRSAEFGGDDEIRAMVGEMFGAAPAESAAGEIRRSGAGGQALFIGRPSAERLRAAFDSLGLAPDVAFEGDPAPTSGNGVFGYIHRRRDGRDVYYFANSSDTPIDSVVTLRGRLSNVQLWNPHDGSVTAVPDVRHESTAGGEVTRFRLVVPPLSSSAVVARGR